MIRRPPSRAELFARIIIATCAVVAVWIIVLRDASAQGILTPAQQHAAEVSAGEVSAQLFGPDAYLDALCTVINRRNADTFPDTLGAVLRAFYATPRHLTPMEQITALTAFQPGGCDGRPWLYALSAGDVARLGFEDGAQVYTYTLPSGRTMAAHFYVSSPWGGR